jgi:hypothetical protein
MRQGITVADTAGRGAMTALPSSKAAATANDQVLPRGKLKEFKLPDVPTILMLGETGVGKGSLTLLLITSNSRLLTNH